MDEKLHKKVDEIKEQLDFIVSIMEVNPEYSSFVKQAKMKREIDKFKKQATLKNERYFRERAITGADTLESIRRASEFSHPQVYYRYRQMASSARTEGDVSIETINSFIDDVLTSNFPLFVTEFEARMRKLNLKLIDINKGVTEIIERFNVNSEK